MAVEQGLQVLQAHQVPAILERLGLPALERLELLGRPVHRERDPLGQLELLDRVVRRDRLG